MNLLKILLLLVLLNCVVLFLSVDCAKLTNLQSEPAVDIKFANNTNSTIDSRSDVVKLNSTSLSVQSPRESSYSYFYVGRWTWHIPLWFTLYFTFYVFGNVIRSIYGHTINPDDYAKRRKRDINESQRLNEITNFAIKSFEKYKNKNR